MVSTKLLILLSIMILANCFLKDNRQDLREFLARQTNRDLKKMNEITNFIVEGIEKYGGANFVDFELLPESSNEEFIDGIIRYVNTRLYYYRSIDRLKMKILDFEHYADEAYKKHNIVPLPIVFK